MPVAPPSAGTLAADAPAPDGLRKIKLAKMALNVPAGAVTFQNSLHTIWGCNLKQTPTVSTGAMVPILATAAYQSAFDAALVKAGLRKNAEADNLFGAAATDTVELSLGGVISALSVNTCSNGSTVKGDASLTIDWQIYSNVDNKIIFRLSTSGVSSAPDFMQGTREILLQKAIQQNAEALVKDAGFRKMLMAAPGIAQGARSQERRVALAPSSARRSIQEVRDATVVIEAGPLTGSGFVVGGDGYILTAAHVVGQLPSVTVLWADGAKSQGKVLESSAARDVALIVTERKMPALPIEGGAPEAGSAVLAVGAPLGKSLFGSVSKGIISGRPRISGHDYLQSDVSINPGNSGGPLVNDQGRVLGIAVSGVHSAQVSGINLFVPIGDALSVLGITRS